MQEGLIEGVWPLHLKPQPDELLSSWLIRFAHAHQLKTESLCSTLFGRQSTIWNRDIDRLAPEWVLDGISRASGATMAQARLTTLAALAGRLSEAVEPQGYARWIVPLRIFHRRRLRPGLMYCPACLAEESRYYRRLWRIAWVTVCVRHRCQLQDACPECGTPIAPHRTDMSSRGFLPSPLTLITCHLCQSLLTQQPLSPALEELITFQAKLEDALGQGFTECGDNPNLHSVLFFNGLRALLTGGLRALKHRMHSPNNRNTTFESRPLAERQACLVLLMHWMDDWPHAFQKEAVRRAFRSSDLSAFQEVLPYWFYRVVRP